MNLGRHNFNRFLHASLAAAALPASVASLVQGRDYDPIQPLQPGKSAGNIEALEFFPCGFPHGKGFHPLATAWAAKRLADRLPIADGHIQQVRTNRYSKF